MKENKVPFGMEDPRVLLRNFRAHLGISFVDMAKFYNIEHRTLAGWVSAVESGAPDLKNNTYLLFDLFAWYFKVVPSIVSKKKKRRSEIAQTTTSLRKFRRYLGFTIPQMALMYGVDRSTYFRWERSSKAGAPDLKNHSVLLRDFFRWFFKDGVTKKDKSLLTVVII